MSVPNTPRNTPREVLPRLGNVLYWVGVVAGAAPILFLLCVAILIFTTETSPHLTVTFWDFAFLSIPWAVICYAIGWSLRYILSGATDEPIKNWINSTRAKKEFFELIIFGLLQIFIWVYLAYMAVQAVIWFRFEGVTWFRKILGW